MRMSRTARRGADERGAAIVEFALVVPLVLLFLFGIITFGIMLAFKQGITQAAAEGARAAAVARPGTAPTEAVKATENGLSGFGKKCGEGFMDCKVEVFKCATPSVTVPVPTGVDECVRVIVTYDYAKKPLIAPLPFIGAALPDTLGSTSVARITNAPTTTP